MRGEFSAAAVMQAANSETGAGYAVVDGQGRFFCGFRQPDKSVQFASFIQRANPGSTPVIERRQGPYVPGHPVFLHPDDMRATGLGAAVFAVRALAVEAEGLSSGLRRDCKLALVRKDLTSHARPEEAGGWFEMPPLSMPGLASSRACAEALDGGYISLFRELSVQAGKIRSALQRGLGLG